MIRTAVARLDRLLGRMTMYRLIDVILGVIVAAALVESLLGLIAFPWFAILAHVAVLLLVSAGANRLLGLIFRTRAHAESSNITALLLALILPPSLDAGGLLLTAGAAALAAVIAAASKYLLAVRGRHVFNPAALGAVVIGLTGLSIPAWWVGTPTLLPFVAVGAFLVLFRTRHIALGLVYVVVAAGIAVVHFVALGAPLDQALSFALLQSPVVFTAGFMLSEPLTLPPRRWQQLLEAVVVAAIASTPITIAGFSTAKPELALLVGNLLAFLVGQRRAIVLTFVGRRQLSPSSWEFEFRPRRPLAFRAGQFLELTLPHAKTDGRGVRRVFSIASAPGADTVRLGIRLPERSSSFKRRLLELAPGELVRATGVGGDFVLPRDPSRKLLLVAGGIGITPYIGQLASAHLGRSGRRDIAVVYAISSLDDLAYADELERSGCRVVLASPVEPSGLPAGWTWIGPGRVTAEAIHTAIPDAAERDVFVSGPPPMVAELGTALKRAGAGRLRTDVFIGY